MVVFSEAGREQIVINSQTERFAGSSKKKNCCSYFPFFSANGVCDNSMCLNASFHFLHTELSGCNANHKATHSLRSSYHFSDPLIMMFKEKMNKCPTPTASLASIYS